MGEVARMELTLNRSHKTSFCSAECQKIVSSAHSVDGRDALRQLAPAESGMRRIEKTQTQPSLPSSMQR